MSRLSVASPESPRLRHAWLAGLLLAAALRLLLIDRHGLRDDEFITFRVMGESYASLLGERLSHSHVPLYFYLVKALTDLFGLSVPVLRIVGAVFGWMAVWATGRLARRLGGLRLGVPVVFAAAIHQVWLATSLEARMYSILVWAAAESTDAWFVWARAGSEGAAGPQRMARLRWMLVSVFALHVHLLYAGVLALQACDALMRRARNGLRFRPLLPSLSVVAIACLPVALAWILRQDKFGEPSPLEILSPGVVLVRAVGLLGGGAWAFGPNALWIAGGLFVLPAIAGLARLLGGAPSPGFEEPSRRDLMALAWACPLFLLGLFLAQMYSAAPILVRERYYTVLLPVVLILGFAGLGRGIGAASRFGTPLLAAALMFQASISAVYYAGPGEGFRESVEIIRADLPPGRGVVSLVAAHTRIGLRECYGGELGREVLDIRGLTHTPGEIPSHLEAYTRRYPEFWVFSYRQDETPIRRVLEDPLNGYEAMNDARKLGFSRVQLYRRKSTGIPLLAGEGGYPVGLAGG